jgi:RNA recognition motif-containing protein
MKKRLFVGNLAWAVTVDDLREHLAEFGKIVDVSIPWNKETDSSKGYGFVEFADAEDAQRAIDKLRETEFKGRTIKVDFAAPRTQRP